MTRIRFEDLPSTNTPRNAENLNKLNNVVISSTEPTTGEEVWVQTNSNLFKEGFRQGGKADYTSTTRVFSTQDLYLKAGTYTLSSNFDTSIYELNVMITNIPYPNSETLIYDSPWITSSPFTFTINQDGYFGLNIRKKNNVNLTPSDISSYDYMLNIGNVALTYEPYVNKKIYTKNDNESYEEFYDETIVKGDLLFAGKTNTNLTLLDNIDNYKELEITHTNSRENMWNIAKIPVMQTTKTVLQRMNVSNTAEKQITQFFFKTITLSGTSLTVDQNRAVFMESSLTDYSAISGTSSSDNSIYITKIVGYK